MRVPNEAKLKWDALRQHGDIESICKESGYGRHTITAAIDGNDCTIEVFSAIQNFYNRRQEEIDSLVNPNEKAA
jgi:hypothetical protein